MLYLSKSERRVWLGQVLERLLGRKKRRRVWGIAIGDVENILIMMCQLFSKDGD